MLQCYLLCSASKHGYGFKTNYFIGLKYCLILIGKVLTISSCKNISYVSAY